jgi:S1-C subfamily serine protease
MSFANYYKKVKPAVVAIVAKVSRNPDFPDIIGTGFIVREDGIVITNDHVVNAIKKLPRVKGAPDDEWPVLVMLLHNIPDRGMVSAFLEVEAVGTLAREEPVEGAYYGPNVPDIGFIYVKVKGLPVVELETSFNLEEGDEVFISGFPMGTRTLRAPGWIHQINPVLQRGIVSAIQPFPCPTPHGLLIDAMVQGGSSGSPIFNAQTAKVEALLYGGLVERNTIPLQVGTNIGLPYTYGTSLTLAIPAFIISELLQKSLFDAKTGMAHIRDTSKHPTLDELFATKEIIVREPKKPISGAKAVPTTEIEFPTDSE